MQNLNKFYGPIYEELLSRLPSQKPELLEILEETARQLLEGEFSAVDCESIGDFWVIPELLEKLTKREIPQVESDAGIEIKSVVRTSKDFITWAHFTGNYFYPQIIWTNLEGSLETVFIAMNYPYRDSGKARQRAGQILGGMKTSKVSIAEVVDKYGREEDRKNFPLPPSLEDSPDNF